MSTHRWSAQFLQSMRDVCDPEADAVIDAVEQAGQVAAVQALSDHLVKNDDVDPSHPAVLPVVVRYFDDIALPPSADQAQIARAQALFAEHAPEIMWLLATASLPTLYACERGAKVLTDTGRLTKQASRRIFETTQFVLNVMAPGGLAHGGYGLRSIQKVRLMHATIRYWIRKKHAASPQSGVWDDAWGQPINQEDLALTLMSFSVVILRGLERFGHVIDPADAEAYVHTWNQIGPRLGIRPELIVSDRADGESLADAICAHQWEHGPAGVELTKALMDFLEGLIPGTLFDGIAPNSVRFLLGNELADLLELPRKDWTAGLLKLVPPLTKVTDAVEHGFEHLFKSPFDGKPVMAYLGEMMLQAFLDVDRGGNRQPFTIPESLGLDIKRKG
jgi:hypothetical protein